MLRVNISSSKSNEGNIVDELFHLFFILYLFIQLMWSNDGRANYILAVHCSTIFLLIICMIKVLELLAKKRLQINYFQMWTLVYIGFYITSTIWSNNYAYTVYPIKNLIKAVTVSFLIAFFFINGKGVEKLFRDIIVVALLAIAFIVIQMTEINWTDILQGTSRFGVYGMNKVNANKLAFIFTFSIFFLLYFKKKGKHKTLCNITILGLCIAILLTKCKTAYLLLIYFFICIYLKKAFSNKTSNRSVYLIVGLLLLIVIGVGTFHIPYVYNMVGWRILKAVESIFQISGNDASTNIRLHRWRFALELLGETPLSSIFGVGIGQYRYMHLIYYAQEAWAEGHFFQLLAEGGFIGLGIHCSIFLFLILKYRRVKHSWGTILLIAVLLMEISAADYGDLMTLLYIFSGYLIIKTENNEVIKLMKSNVNTQDHSLLYSGKNG